jgi:hypothetical protein
VQEKTEKGQNIKALKPREPCSSGTRTQPNMANTSLPIHHHSNQPAPPLFLGTGQILFSSYSSLFDQRLTLRFPRRTVGDSTAVAVALPDFGRLWLLQNVSHSRRSIRVISSTHSSADSGLGSRSTHLCKPLCPQHSLALVSLVNSLQGNQLQICHQHHLLESSARLALTVLVLSNYIKYWPNQRCTLSESGCRGKDLSNLGVGAHSFFIIASIPGCLSL